jgi:hypothetical protein
LCHSFPFNIQTNFVKKVNSKDVSGMGMTNHMPNVFSDNGAPPVVQTIPIFQQITVTSRHEQTAQHQS